MRWLYCRQKPENNLLFGYNKADEVRRLFLIPLWNVYTFFVTYANIDGWTPDGIDEGSLERNALDRWILARLHQVVETVDERLADYDAYGATLVVEPFLDDLSNWYVRRSRRRFWKSEQDADKNAAYATLYEVLTTLARLLAPFIPFVTEAMYQNLVRSVDDDAFDSVHHATWPEADESLVDMELLEQMERTRAIVTLGHSARSSENVKLRQPLAKAEIHLQSGEEGLTEELIDLIRDELNVKQVEFIDDVNRVLTYRLLPVNNVLGPRFGSQFPAVREALSKLEPVPTVKRLRAELPLRFEVEGEEIELAPDEVLVQEEAREGLSVASDNGVTVAVDVTITPELELEGLAREVVRRVQTLRKEADFELDDRIVTGYEADGKLADAIDAHRDEVKAETLSVELMEGEVVGAEATGEYEVDGYDLKLSVRRA